MNQQNIGWKLANSYAQLPSCLFTKTKPSIAPNPQLVILNQKLAQILGLNFTSLTNNQIVQQLTGIMLPEGADPLAQAYAGHQYGYFTILGDGRAILLGEQITPDNKRFDIHLKGAGQTVYSRRGDGKAPLAPMLREYIISESMYALGIPTTQSLAVIKTGETVYRETALPGAILVRIAASHLRVGTFQFAALQTDPTVLAALLHYTINRHYPELQDSQNPTLELLKTVINRQAKLITEWMRVGFVHGVMNTDNMAISGETIDYGPCAFIDEYSPDAVFSSIDFSGRYAFANQPVIAQWNLARLAESLLPLLHVDINKAVEMAEEAIASFKTIYQAYWLDMIKNKLGLVGQEQTDKQLIDDLLSLMHKYKLDYTNTFFNLMTIESMVVDLQTPANSAVSDELNQWLSTWKQRIARNNVSLSAAKALMKQYNPVVIPRNHKVEAVLRAAVEQDDLKPMKDFLDVLAHPYDILPATPNYQKAPKDNERVCRTFCGT